MTETKQISGLVEFDKTEGKKRTLKIEGQFYGGFSVKAPTENLKDKQVNVTLKKNVKDDKEYWNLASAEVIETKTEDLAITEDNKRRSKERIWKEQCAVLASNLLSGIGNISENQKTPSEYDLAIRLIKLAITIHEEFDKSGYFED